MIPWCFWNPVHYFNFKLFSFYLYNKIYELGKEKYEKQLLKEEIQMYERRFETMQQSRDRIRALRHDLLHHLQMLQHFALTGNTEQLVDYIGRMNEQIENRNKRSEYRKRCRGCHSGFHD